MQFYHSLSALLGIHLIAGFIAAFTAFPLALFVKKGSKIHVAAGRVFVVSFIVICFSGYYIESDELLKIPLIKASVCSLYPSEFCKYQDSYLYSRSHFLISFCINTFALYLCVSGWRLATQHRLGNKTKRAALFDANFAILELIAVSLFSACLFYDIHLSYALTKAPVFWYYLIVTIIACVPLVDAGRDLYFAVTLKQAKFWWIMHMRKMLMAEYGLIIAFFLRCSKLHDYWLLAIITVGFLGLYLRFSIYSPPFLMLKKNADLRAG